MSSSISTLMTRNLREVFGENDPARRRAAIDEIFTEDCVFYDPSTDVYRGRDAIDRVAGTIKATHPDFRYQPMAEPLPTPMGILPPTGKRMDAPCCDVFRLVNGKIKSFDCYPSGTVIFAQLGVLSNIEAAIAHSCGTLRIRRLRLCSAGRSIQTSVSRQEY